MNGFDEINDASGHFENTRGATMFYDSPHDLRKSIVAGQSVLCVMAEISQFHVSDARKLSVYEAKELGASSEECALEGRHESDEHKKEGEEKTVRY